MNTNIKKSKNYSNSISQIKNMTNTNNNIIISIPKGVSVTKSLEVSKTSEERSLKIRTRGKNI